MKTLLTCLCLVVFVSELSSRVIETPPEIKDHIDGSPPLIQLFEYRMMMKLVSRDVPQHRGKLVFDFLSEQGQHARFVIDEETLEDMEDGGRVPDFRLPIHHNKFKSLTVTFLTQETYSALFISDVKVKAMYLDRAEYINGMCAYFSNDRLMNNQSVTAGLYGCSARHLSDTSVQDTFSERHGNKTYHVYRQKRTFQEAHEYCAQNGRRLVRTENERELDWVGDMLRRKQVPLPVWLDAVKNGGNFTWTDGTAIGWDNWNQSSFSECSGTCYAFISKDFALNGNEYYAWSVAQAHVTLSVVCEEPLVSLFKSSKGVRVFSHQYRFSQLFDDKVYHVDGQKRTFQDAQQYCVENGHRLLRIESQLEQDWIVEKLQGVAVPFPVWLDVVKYGDTYYWSDQRGILWNNWDDYSRSHCSGVCRVYLSEHRNRNPYDPYSAQLAIGTWLAMDTTEAHTVVCEEPYLVTAPDSVFKVTNGQQSDSETLTAQLGVKLYYMPLQYMTRINAEIYCNLQHDHVARVTNFAEQTWLQANMAEGSRFWTGAQLEAANASHISIIWPPDGDAVTWTNWEDGEPICSSDCSVLVDKNGKWITKPFKGPMVSKTICERDLFKSINDRISEMQRTSAYLFGTLSGIGVTCGAHRLWAHKAYSAKLPLRIFLVILHTMAGQNDMFTWVRDHRLHHKYTETDADPHNSRRGAFFAHVGWLLTKKHPDVLIKGRSISNDDIMADPVCFYQKKYYVIMYLFFRLILPMTVPMYMWDEQFQWAFVGVFAQYITSLHITWFVNSAAHIFGDRPYNDKIQPRENIWVTWIVLGEGFHNYHHTFPWDYRIAETGLTWYDPARLFIDTMAYMGLAYNLKRASETVVSRTRQTLGSSSSHRDSVQGDINVKKVPSCDLEFYVNDHPYEKPQPYCDDTNETDPLIS
ncbi:Stearoyl-CoA desaturase 5 [Halotydeus destructor]|nr:Stearoyl-CoA desaturase 5 [Halotydeus destructor]